MCLRALFSSSLFPHCWLDSCAAHFARYEICILCSNYWHFNLLLLVSIHLLFIFIVRMRKWKLKLKLKYTHTHTSHRLYLPTLFSMWIEIARRKNSSREKIITKFKIKIEKLRQCDAICKSNRRMQTKHAHLTVAHKCYVQFFFAVFISWCRVYLENNVEKNASVDSFLQSNCWNYHEILEKKTVSRTNKQSTRIIFTWIHFLWEGIYVLRWARIVCRWFHHMKAGENQMPKCNAIVNNETNDQCTFYDQCGNFISQNHTFSFNPDSNFQFHLLFLYLILAFPFEMQNQLDELNVRTLLKLIRLIDCIDRMGICL